MIIWSLILSIFLLASPAKSENLHPDGYYEYDIAVQKTISIQNLEKHQEIKEINHNIYEQLVRERNQIINRLIIRYNNFNNEQLKKPDVKSFIAEQFEILLGDINQDAHSMRTKIKFRSKHIHE